MLLLCYNMFCFVSGKEVQRWSTVSLSRTRVVVSVHVKDRVSTKELRGFDRPILIQNKNRVRCLFYVMFSSFY